MNTEEFMRRLPVYLLLDTSASMFGSAIQAVQQGVHMIHNELLNNPHAIETVVLSVITFASSAQQITPLSTVEDFKPPTLKAEGNTALGSALTLLDQAIEREVKTNAEGRKGDYRPIVFLLTDGAPTDEWKPAVAKLKARPGIKVNSIVAIGCGPSVNMSTLNEISTNVIRMTETSPDSIKQFFKWVSASIQRTSQKMVAKADDTNLDAVPLPSVLKWDKTDSSS